jgi:hypothetical protein
MMAFDTLSRADTRSGVRDALGSAMEAWGFLEKNMRTSY